MSEQPTTYVLDEPLSHARIESSLDVRAWASISVDACKHRSEHTPALVAVNVNRAFGSCGLRLTVAEALDLVEALSKAINVLAEVPA